MILVIDNYDSFTYNLVQYMGEVTNRSREIRVVRNDSVSVADIRAMRPAHLILSPGPCTPNDAGITVAAVRELTGELPILGVCLGHQAIAQAFGGHIVRASEVVHGKTSAIYHSGRSIFAGIENGFTATRYHSLVVEKQSVPDVLSILAWSGPDNAPRSEIMAIEHRVYPNVIGVQFHPESILTNVGKLLLSRFLLLK